MAKHHLCNAVTRAASLAALLLLVMFLCPLSTQAGHISGNSITYQCVNACTVRVEFRAYRDCSSPITNVSPIGTLFISTDSGCVPPTPIYGWVNASNIEVTPVCPGTPTLCNTPGASFNGIMEHYWVREYDFCAANCPNYTIYWGTCCRNGNITTLSNPASMGLYTSTTINPLLLPCNSSPSFDNPPIAYICENQSYLFSQGATDPDGDSLSYSIGPCRRSATQGVPYLAWTSPTQPLGPDWSVSLNPTNGDLSIIPNLAGPNPGSIQVGVICVYVTEWRGGIAINTIERDMQVNVIPCNPNDHPQATPFMNASNGSVNGFTLETCVGASVCASIRVLDLDFSQVKTLWWDQSLAPLGATFVSSVNTSITDTVVGVNPAALFCWTPTQAGTYTFVVHVHDDACPIYGENQYTYTVVVGQIATTADTVVSGCHAVSLCAAPTSGTMPFSYLWSGPGGLNSNPNRTDSCLFHTYPVQGQFPFTLQITDAWGCVANFIDTISILNNVAANAGPDTSTCSSQPLVIGVQPGTNPNLVYSWAPSFGLNNTGIAQPTVTIANGGQLPLLRRYILTVTDTATQCSDLDTMFVTIFPIPESPFIAPDSACVNQAVATIYSGNNGPSASYQWTFSGGLPPAASGQGPQQVYFTTPGLHEISLSVTQNGCTSPVERDTIFIIPRPVAQINPAMDQCLANNSFQFSSQGPPSATAIYNWQFWPNASPSSSNAVYPNGIVFATAGVKRITLQMTENGCSGNIDTLLLNVFADPNPNWTVIGGVQCFQGNDYHFQTTGTNSGGAMYSWTFQDGSPSTSTSQTPQVSFASPGPKVVTLTVVDNGCTASRTDTILVFPEPLADAGPGQTFCEGDGGVTLQGIAMNGSAPYYYQWSCSAPICGIDSIYDDNPTVNPGSSTWYYLHVVDVNGCESLVDSVFVTVNPKPIVDAGPDRYLCGDSAPCQVLTPTVSGAYGPYGYQWLPFNGLNSTGIANPCARPDTTTIYTLVATDLATGCSSDYTTTDTLATVTVHVNPIPIANAGHDRDICPGDTALLIGTGSGAGPSYIYEWSPANGLPSISNPTAHASPASTFQYSLVVWSNGCPSYADSVWVNVHTMPSVDAGWDREICLGEAALLDATAGGDSTASYSFQWSQTTGLNNPFVEDPIAAPHFTTTYYVVATSSWGCDSPLDSVTVRLRPTPIAEAGPNLSVCEGDSIRLPGSYGYTTTDSAPANQVYFAWTPALHIDDSTLIQPMSCPQSSGWYNLSVTYGLCTTHDSLFMTFVPDLRAQALADTLRICEGDSILLSALGGLGNANFEWTPPTGIANPHAAATHASPPTSMTYWMLVSEAGCADTAAIQVEVLPRPTAAFIHSSLEGCAPHQVSFMNNSAGSNFVYWNFGDGSPISNEDNPLHAYAQPGTYAVTMTAVDTGHCDSRSLPVTVMVHEPPQLFSRSSPEAPATLYLPHAEVRVAELGANIESVFWEFGDGIRAQGPLATHNYAEAGTYFVQVVGINPQGCRAEQLLGPFIVLPPDLDIPNVFSPNGDGVNDVFQARYTGDAPYHMELRDRWGQALFTTQNKLQGWDGRTPSGAKSPDGTYYYIVRVGEREYAGAFTLLR